MVLFDAAPNGRNKFNPECVSAPIDVMQGGIVVSSSASQELACRRAEMSIATFILILLILLFLGALPTWPHSRTWGYRPGGAIGIILLVLIVLLLTGRLN